MHNELHSLKLGKYSRYVAYKFPIMNQRRSCVPRVLSINLGTRSPNIIFSTTTEFLPFIFINFSTVKKNRQKDWNNVMFELNRSKKSKNDYVFSTRT